MSRPSAKVYRAVARDRHGDPINAQGEVVQLGKDGFGLVGEIKNVMLGGLSASPSMARQESSNTSGQIGIPNRRNQIKVVFGDRLLIGIEWFKVVSPPRWDYSHSMTGSRPEYHWIGVEATVG